MNAITSATPLVLPEISPTSSSAQTSGGTGFRSMLEAYIGSVQTSQNQATQTVENFLAGGTEELHSVALTAQRASLEFEMFMQVRNKVVSAYQEVMKMQL